MARLATPKTKRRQKRKLLKAVLARDYSLVPHVPSIDSLEDISQWLGTFRERLRVARNVERQTVAAAVQELEARYQLRRAELS